MAFHLLALLLAVSLPAPATPPVGDGVASNAPASGAKEKKICKRNGKTATRIGSTRVCMTASEWQKANDAGFKGYRDATRNSD